MTITAKRELFQTRVLSWMMECFSNDVCRDGTERNHRFLEESLELVQARGCTRSEAHQLVEYVFDRPIGEPFQEVGGVMVTLAALCAAGDLNMDAAAEAELARIWTKIDQIRAKQAAKPKHSPLPAARSVQAPASGEAAADAAMTKIWAKWFAFYERHFRGPSIAISMADQQAFYEIAQPIMRALCSPVDARPSYEEQGTGYDSGASGHELQGRQSAMLPHDIVTAAISGLSGNGVLTMGERATALISELERQGYEIAIPSAPTAAEAWPLIEALRAPEGHSVTLVCDNPDFGPGPNAKVIVCGDWTGWDAREYPGDTVLDALKTAHAAMIAAASP
jgi:hypothetical protein